MYKYSAVYMNRIVNTNNKYISKASRFIRTQKPSIYGREHDLGSNNRNAATHV